MQTEDSGNAHPAFLAARDFLLQHYGDPDGALRDFRWPRLERFNWALDYFDTMAQGNDAPALWITDEKGGEEKFSFQEMSDHSARTANFLRRHGVQRGDRVLLMLGNESALWESMLGVFKLGAVIIPASVLLTPEDLRDRLERGHVQHVIAGSAHTQKFGGIEGDYTRIAVGSEQPGWLAFEDTRRESTRFTPEGETQAADPLLLYFTSGTTSQPKLVQHTQQSYPVGHLSTMHWIGLQPGDIHLNVSSPGWAKHAWSSFFAPWNAGACIFVHNAERFDARGLLDALARYGVTTLCAPPTVWRLLIQEDMAAWRDRVRLRELVGAGEPLNPEILEQVRTAWGLELRDGYGQTETSAQIANTPGLALKPGAMGRPLPGFQVTLIDADGRDGDEGEVCLELGAAQPTGLMTGYLDDAEKTAEAMRDGLYHTGDMATRDADGYLTFVGRADDVFKSSDYRISPFELESVLIEHAAITEVAVVPSPDPLRLSVPKAFITVSGESTPDNALARTILAFARQQLAPYKRIRRIEFVVELPKTISGKIRRVDLRNGEHERRDHDQREEKEYFEEDFPDLKKNNPGS